MLNAEPSSRAATAESADALVAAPAPDERRRLPGGAAIDRLSRRMATLSTGVKLMILIGLALAPLGLIAILASIDTARVAQGNRATASRAIAVDSGRTIDALVARTALTLRTAALALADDDADRSDCRRTLGRLAAAYRIPVQFALMRADGRLICSTGRLRPDAATIALAGTRDPAVGIDAAGDALFVTTRAGAAGDRIGIARFDRAAIVAASHPQLADGHYRLRLRGAEGTMALADLASRGAFDADRIAVPVAAGQLTLDLTLPSPRVTASEMLAITLPGAMLVAAGLIAFLVIDRLMLRPLKQLERAVLAYRSGDRRIAIPHLTTPAYEIRTLADAFRGVSDTIVRHEAELEEGLARQTRLTREVHHRVKNNLQVVASLLNLHARGARSRDVADAYAAIQRRVDALAIVHRNHYADFEENRGISLRALIGELATNLRANAPAEAAAMPILLDVAPLHAAQDVAVPVAFLVTELIEAAMLGAPKERVTIALKPLGGGRARLTVSTGTIPTEEDGGHALRGRRVMEGLARQLRTTLHLNEGEGGASIEIGVTDDV